MKKVEKQTGNQADRRVCVALEDVRSAHNVGSIFRTADGAGACGLYLIGTTPAPIDRFGRAQPDIAKTALGAEKILPWTYFEKTDAFLAHCRAEELKIVVAEQDERAVDYRGVACEGDCVVVFGNEVGGVPREARDTADYIISIPMRGKKESLNVSVAAGIVLYQMLDG